LIEKLKVAEPNVKMLWMKETIDMLGNSWRICVRVLKKVIVETGIKELKLIGLMDLPVKEEVERKPIYDLGSFNRIPNVKNFNVAVKDYDWLVALFGLRLRFKPTISIEEYKNKGMNRYIEHQVRRLDKCMKEGNTELY